MLRNIDNTYTSRRFLQELLEAGVLTYGDFDFFYLPIDFATSRSVGYGFINLTSVDKFLPFVKKYCHYKFTFGTTGGDFRLARVQGLANNIEHYRNNPVMCILNELAKPLLFSGHHYIPFPTPTKPVYPPSFTKYRVAFSPGGWSEPKDKDSES